MTGTDLFSQHLSQINGVEGFIVLRKDGHILAHNVAHAENYASLATLSGISAQGVQKTMGFTPFHHLAFTRIHAPSLIVFTLDKFYVGVVAKGGANLSELIEDVNGFLLKIKIKKNSGHSPKEEG